MVLHWSSRGCQARARQCRLHTQMRCLISLQAVLIASLMRKTSSNYHVIPLTLTSPGRH